MGTILALDHYGIGDYDEQDVANDLEDSIYDDGDDVREFLESVKLCCAANP